MQQEQEIPAKKAKKSKKSKKSPRSDSSLETEELADEKHAETDSKPSESESKPTKPVEEEIIDSPSSDSKGDENKPSDHSEPDQDISLPKKHLDVEEEAKEETNGSDRSEVVPVAIETSITTDLTSPDGNEKPDLQEEEEEEVELL